MAIERKAKICFGIVILGILLVVAGFICLLVALTLSGVDWTALIIAGSVIIGIGFISALIAALYLTLRDESEYSFLRDDSKKKSKPHLSAVPSLKGVEPVKSYPQLSTGSKDHIYKMTLNLGSVDVRSEVKQQPDESNNYEELVNEGAAAEYESPTNLQPGVADGTKQFKD